ncbi:MAG: DUF4349 domain-containing protein [Planctomycetota bacterium]|nr:DUF4349 domain-containing protein [Planctomycetota bacterium]
MIREISSQLIVLGAIGMLSLGGCGDASYTSMDTAMPQAAMDFGAAGDVEESAEIANAEFDAESGSDMPASSDAALETNRQLIYVADVRLVVEDFSTLEGKQGISQLIEKHGGHAADMSIDRNQGRARSGQWRARIPVKNYRAFLDDLKELGVPEHFRETTEDVTAQYVDLDARIRNKKQLETRILELLGRTVGKVSDLIEVERELGRVRGEIERMESMFRSLKSRIQMTTVTINAREERGYEPPQAPSFGSRISKAWSDSIYGLGEGLKNLLIGLVSVIPWLVLWVPAGGVLWLLWRRWRRRRRDG